MIILLVANFFNNKTVMASWFIEISDAHPDYEISFREDELKTEAGDEDSDNEEF